MQVQEEAGAVISDAATAAPLVAHFGDPRTEYNAARTDAVVFDLSDRTQIDLCGNDRQQFLHNFCTNEINALHPGQGCEGRTRSICQPFA